MRKDVALLRLDFGTVKTLQATSLQDRVTDFAIELRFFFAYTGCHKNSYGKVQQSCLRKDSISESFSEAATAHPQPHCAYYEFRVGGVFPEGTHTQFKWRPLITSRRRVFRRTLKPSVQFWARSCSTTSLTTRLLSICGLRISRSIRTGGFIRGWWIWRNPRGRST